MVALSEQFMTYLPFEVLWKARTMDDEPQNKKSLRQRLQEAYDWIKEIGWPSFKNGDWLFMVVQRSFKAFYENANADYFRGKYPRLNDEAIAKKLIAVSAKNAALLGATTGAAVSVDELTALVASVPTGGLNLPAQITVATTALAAEAVVLVRIQLQLIANIAKLFEVQLDPDDPEDVMLILQFAFGGAVAEKAGKFAAKTAGSVTKRVIKKKLSGPALKALQKTAAKLGVKVLQRSVIKYAVPLASSVVGGTWNYMTTKKIGGIAMNHFQKFKEERT